MNINLRDVICTSRDGDKFWRINECYIRGSTIKYLRIPDEVIDAVKEEVHGNKQKRDVKRGPPSSNRGGRGGRGGGAYHSGDRNFGQQQNANKYPKRK